MNGNEKRSGILLLGLTILKGISDTIGVASILPFLSILGQPELINTNPYASMLYEVFGFSSIEDFLFAFGIVVIFILVFSSVLKVVTVYATNRWVEMREYYLSRRLFQVYLRQPYAYYLTHNTSDMATSILSLTRGVVIGIYRPAVNLFSATVSLILIVTLLLWANPFMTSMSVLVVGGSYLALFFFLRGFIKRKGRIMIRSNKAKFRRVHETLTGIKQVKLSSNEHVALARYAEPSQQLAQARAISSTLSQVPRFGLEAFAFGGIVVLTLILFSQSDGAIEKSLPLLGLYAFAGYRLLPAAQTIYNTVVTLRVNIPAIDTVYDDMKDTDGLAKLPHTKIEPMSFNSLIKFDAVGFNYPESDTIGLKGIDLEIYKGESLGIVGTTGAGKTTLVDVLLGLLKITSGSILVDGIRLDADNVRSWQASFGYVPQDIFLSDASVAENIAMGIEHEHISIEKLERVTKAARLHDFIINDMPEGFDTRIGERGVRLSGGQRQRLGIARALYNDPQIIVFDEATSALDNTTERELISEISQMSGERTIIMIAHRLSTIENCDQIVMLDKGKIIGKGTYTELLDSNPVFEEMASHQKIRPKSDQVEIIRS